MHQNNPHRRTPIDRLKLGRTTLHTCQTRHSLNIHLPRHQPRGEYRSSSRIRVYRHHLLNSISRLYASQKEYRRHRQRRSSSRKSPPPSQILPHHLGNPPPPPRPVLISRTKHTSLRIQVQIKVSQPVPSTPNVVSVSLEHPSKTV